MEPKAMSVADVLKENLRILNGLRIPVSEREIWGAVSGVAQNTQLCIEAIERAEAEAKAKKDGEEDSNVIQLEAEGQE